MLLAAAALPLALAGVGVLGTDVAKGQISGLHARSVLEVRLSTWRDGTGHHLSRSGGLEWPQHHSAHLYSGRRRVATDEWLLTSTVAVRN